MVDVVHLVVQLHTSSLNNMKVNGMDGKLTRVRVGFRLTSVRMVAKCTARSATRSLVDPSVNDLLFRPLSHSKQLRATYIACRSWKPGFWYPFMIELAGSTPHESRNQCLSSEKVFVEQNCVRSLQVTIVFIGAVYQNTLNVKWTGGETNVRF